ncbi:hypothetical protein C9374_007597 [Naegleria lovaniensis]|uniref:Tripartite motif-containing protein 2 n=1 Tax=Naegleria lovaniensis TaxID=51637 RepID=A0AA88KLI7_NAELO|nr:uncharacterized protein C9374_007597 [Naegleria lovaniensis]KAG2378959.1 hypothetical protein C9374_007597 [Naegleria lovaniensis]
MNHQNVTIILHDLIRISGNNYQDDQLQGIPNILSKFYNKMRNFKKKVPFSLNFEFVASIKAKDVVDVRISHSCNCILGLCNNEQDDDFFIFDLNTHELVRKFSTIGRPSYFDIEENYDGNGHDAVVYGGSNGVVKHDLNKLLDGHDVHDYIWQVPEIKNSRGIVSTKHETTNTIYVSYEDTCNCIAALNSRTGEILFKMGKDFSNNFQLELASGLEMSNTNDVLFVSDCNMKRIHKLSRSHCHSDLQTNTHTETHSWRSECIFEDAGIKYPDGLVFDSVSRHVLVCDSVKGGIIVYQENGKFVKFVRSSEEDSHELNGPTGLCLDEQTGFLYVADESNHIQIFQ